MSRRGAALLCLAGLLGTPGCRGMPVRDGASRPPAAECEPRIPSNDGHYALCYTTTPEAIPLNEPFAMEVWVYDGDRPDVLTRTVYLDVDAAMPEHRHGMNRIPRVRALVPPSAQVDSSHHPYGAAGDGRFEVSGMLLHMPGRWEIHFDVTRGAITERVQVEVVLE